MEDVRLESCCLLADLYCEAGQIPQSKQILQEAMKNSQRLPYWHCRLLFQLAVIFENSIKFYNWFLSTFSSIFSRICLSWKRIIIQPFKF